MITQERLKQRYRYNKHTGVFTRLFNRAAAIKGTKVTTEHGPSGHLQIVIDRIKYPPSNLAWLYVYGVYPKCIVDHKNNNPKNNRIKNLRLASYSQNSFNCPLRCDNKTGIKGVTKLSDGRYRVRISAFKKLHHLGYCRNLKEAAIMRRKASKRLHGNFARA